MTKIIARIVGAALLLGALPGLALAAENSAKSTTQATGASGHAADISGGDMTHGCSPSTTPCK
ncbi:MAG: hypothetical protein WAN51_12930 [Alphaproteobacteria bacterium]